VVEDETDFALGQNLVLLRADGRKVLPEFLQWLVVGPAWWEQVNKFLNVGAVFDSLKCADVPNFRLPIPPVHIQGDICGSLGPLSDRIDLNRRMNETLEAMARAIFRDWFVEFGPTRAKMEGRAPYLAPEVWSLFPDALGEDGLPVGWKSSTVGNEFVVVMGQSPPGETYTTEPTGLPFYQGKTDFTERFPARRIYCTAPTRRANAGDALISVRAPVGALNMAAEECCLGRGVAALRHRSGSRGYTYYTVMTLQPALAAFEDNGTVFGAINKDSLNGLSVLAPPRQIVEVFEQFSSPLDDRFAANVQESRTLASLRDILLPRLMSGELRLRDAEALVEAAQ
jgi:type I restriction enzyme S subunit